MLNHQPFLGMSFAKFSCTSKSWFMIIFQVLLRKGGLNTLRMKGYEIASCLSKFPITYSLFDGVIKIQDLDSSVPARQFHFYVVLQSNHWIIVRKDNTFISVFDSLGYQGQRQLTLSRDLPYDHFVINSTTLQSPTSKSCGIFTIVVAVEWSLNPTFSLHELLNHLFSRNTTKNEIVVANWMKNHGIQQSFHWPSCKGASFKVWKGAFDYCPAIQAYDFWEFW